MGTAGGQGLNHFKPVPAEMCARQTREMYAILVFVVLPNSVMKTN